MGAEYHRRFIPQKWDANGIALDDFGIPSPDTACPHCHERLPAGFGEFKQYIYSIVGAPSSGKSYYLAILLKQLKRYLFHRFEISFMDQDPEYNIQINEVIQTLFSARSAVEGRIIKTDMRGGITKASIEMGRKSIYLSRQCLIFLRQMLRILTHRLFFTTMLASIFYLLIAVLKSSRFCMWQKHPPIFLYDPLSNIDIRHSLSNVESDQLKRKSDLDQQPSILSQMNVKISRVLGKATSEKLETPLAILIGKCDLWHSLVPDWDKLVDPIGKKNVLHQDAVDLNSNIIRDFLNEYAPDIVATAERISRSEVFPYHRSVINPRNTSFLISRKISKLLMLLLIQLR